MKQRTVFFWCALIAALVWTQAGRAQAKDGEATVDVGSTVQISIGAAYQRTLNQSSSVSSNWRSENTSCVQVTSSTNKYCYVKGIKATSSPVRVLYSCSYTLDGHYRTMNFYYDVTVKSTAPTKVEISPTRVTMELGSTKTLYGYVYPTSCSKADFIWECDGANIISVKKSNSYVGQATVTANRVGKANVWLFYDWQKELVAISTIEVVDSRKTITYTTDDGKWTQTYKVKAGDPYPTPDAGYMVEFGDVPTGTVSTDESFTLSYTTRYNIAPTVDDIQQYYTLDIDGQHPVFSSQFTLNKTNIYALGCSDETEPLRYDRGAAPDDTYAWAFVGDPFGQVQLYGKDAKAFLQVGGEALSFTATHPSTMQDNEIALQTGTQYLGRNGSALTTSTTPTSLRAFPIQAAEATYTRTFGAAYGTLVLPFYAPIPDGMTAYTCATVDGNTLQLTAVDDQLLPNTPYIVENAEGATFTFANTSLGDYADPVSEGLLTGIYAAAEAPTGSFVLQKQNGVLGFYQVETPVTVQPNRCYLTLDGSLAKAFYFSTTSTAVDALEALTDRSTEIYDLQGRRLQRLQKGVNIVGGHKVFVK